MNTDWPTHGGEFRPWMVYVATGCILWILLAYRVANLRRQRRKSEGT